MPEKEENIAEETTQDGPRTTLERTAPCEVKIKVEADADYLRKQYQEELEQLRAELSLPGFRRGKAPISLVEKRVGSSLKSDIILSMLADAAREAVFEHELHLVGELDLPDSDDIVWEPGQPFEYEITGHAMPELELKPEDYKGLQVDLPIMEVTDEMMEAQEQQFLARFTTIEEVEDAEVQDGDYLEGALTLPGTDMEDEELGFYLAAGTVGPLRVNEPEEALRGARVGDEVELTGTVSEEDIEDYELEGVEPDQEVTATFKIDQIMRRQVPELDDELAEKMGMESADEVRDYLRTEIEQSLEQHREELQRDMVIGALLEKFSFEVPDTLVESQTRQAQMRELVRMLREGVPREEAEARVQQNQYGRRESARRALQANYLLTKISEQERVFVTEGDVEAQIRAYASQQGWREERARDYLEERGMIRSLRADMREERTVEMLIEEADFNMLSREEWIEKYGAPAEEEAPDEQAATEAAAEADETAEPAEETAAEEDEQAAAEDQAPDEQAADQSADEE